ncbi:MAG TPA: LysM peptidoglycan-binding domain-containing protein [Candidatus Eisenbacteria bacterium]
MKLATAVCAAALWVVGAGCGKPVLRVADASLGDYYSEKEYKKLSKEQREEYCGELAEQRETYLGQVADAQEALAAIRRRAVSRGAEVESLRATAARLEESLASERTEKGGAPSGGENAGAAPPRAGSYVVKSGDSLWRISGRGDVLGRATEWRRLYEANRDRIHDPDRIYPGQEIEIPR